MSIDPKQLSEVRLPSVTVEVERGILRFFAKATGQADPIYTDLGAARQAGHPDLPVPPTFFFSLELAGADPHAYLTQLGVDMNRILHGEQSFTYHSLAYAGETLKLTPAVVDVYRKKGGALEFLVKQTDIARSNGEPVAKATTVIAIQHPEASHDHH